MSAHCIYSCIPKDAARFERDCCTTDDGNTAALQTNEQT